jgi:hypothetical protein
MKQTVHLVSVGLMILLMSFVLPVKAKVGYRYTTFDNGIAISTNAKTGDALVIFTASKNSKATILVKDENGAIVLSQKATLAIGKNKINIHNFNQLKEGSYTVCLSTAAKEYAVPVLFWK